MLITQVPDIKNKPCATSYPQTWAVPQLGQFMAACSSRRAGFNPRTVNVEFVAEKVVLLQVFLRVLQFSAVSYHSTITPYSSIIILTIQGWDSWSTSGRSNKGFSLFLSQKLLTRRNRPASLSPSISRSSATEYGKFCFRVPAVEVDGENLDGNFL